MKKRGPRTMIENFVRGPFFARFSFVRFSSESDAASPRQTQTDNDASGSPQRVAGRPPLSSVWGTVLHLTGQKSSGEATEKVLRRSFCIPYLDVNATINHHILFVEA